MSLFVLTNMKNIFVICFMVFYFNGTEAFSNEEKGLGGLDIKGFIEKLLEEIKEKIPEEFTFSDRNIIIPQFLDEYIAGTLDLRNISFTGLKEFETSIEYQPIVPIPKKYSVTVEYLSWRMDYKSDLSICESKYLSIFGEGGAIITLRKLQIGGDISISLIPLTAITTVSFEWDGVTIELSGLLNDDTFSSKVSQVVGKTVTNVSENFKKPLSSIFTKIINYIIKLAIPLKRISNTTELKIKDLQVFNENMILNKTVVNENNY